MFLLRLRLCHLEHILHVARLELFELVDVSWTSDGDDQPYDGYPGHWSIKASTSARPTVVDRKKQKVEKKDGLLYSGCFVNAIIDPWVQDNSFGKRVNATLTGVQFFADGDPFTGGRPADVDKLEELEPSDMEEVF